MEANLGILLFGEGFRSRREGINRHVNEYYQVTQDSDKYSEHMRAVEPLINYCGFTAHTTKPLIHILNGHREAPTRKTIATPGMAHHFATHTIHAAMIGKELATLVLALHPYLNQTHPRLGAHTEDAALAHEVLEEDSRYRTESGPYNAKAFRESEKADLDRASSIAYEAAGWMTPPPNLPGIERKAITPMQVLRSRILPLYLAHIAERSANAADTDNFSDGKYVNERKLANRKWEPQRFIAAAEDSVEVLCEARDDLRAPMITVAEYMAPLLDIIRHERGVPRSLINECKQLYRDAREKNSHDMFDKSKEHTDALELYPPTRVIVLPRMSAPSSMSAIRP